MELWERVRRIADFMGLRVWNIAVVEKPTEEDEEGAYARCLSSDEGHEADIVFYKDFYEAEEHEQRRIIIHELGHCIFAPLDESIEGYGVGIVKLIEKLDPSAEWAADAVNELYRELYKILRERTLDQFARLVNDAAELGLTR